MEESTAFLNEVLALDALAGVAFRAVERESNVETGRLGTVTVNGHHHFGSLQLGRVRFGYAKTSSAYNETSLVYFDGTMVVMVLIGATNCLPEKLTTSNEELRQLSGMS